MAIATLGTAASGVRNNSSGTTIDATHTLEAGDNRVAIAIATIEDGSAIASCTYGGVAMTALTEKAHSSGGTAVRQRMFYLLHASLPADGSRTVTVTGTDAFLSGVLHVFTLQGVIQTTPEATGTGEETTDTVVTAGITTINNNAWIISGAGCNTNSTWTHGADQTEILDTSSGSSNSVAATCTYEIKATAGAETESHTCSVSAGELVIFQASFAPFVEGGFFMFF